MSFTAEQAAYTVVTMLNSSVLADADAVLDDGVGAWVSKAVDQRHRLSGGERVLLDLVLFFYNGSANPTLTDLMLLDRATLAQVLAVVRDRFGA